MSFLLLWAMSSCVSLAFDMDWYIRPQIGFPQVHMDDDGRASVQFMYEIPALNEHKWTDVTLFQDDCVTPATEASLSKQSTLLEGENLLKVDVYVAEDTIVESPYWTEHADGVNGFIDFCLRVDLFLDVESENFHETKMKLNVNLTSGFYLVEHYETHTSES